MIADKVWSYLGKTHMYVEPFFGSGAVLLANPFDTTHEIVNDSDSMITNFWRAVRKCPDQVAYYAYAPVSQADLHARRNYILKSYEVTKHSITTDPEWCDCRQAGYWVYCISCWIGDGFIPADVKPKDTICKVPTLNHHQGMHKCKTEKELQDWLLKLSQRLKRVTITCGDWSSILGGNWRTQNRTCSVFLDPPYSFGVEGRFYTETNNNTAHDVRKWCVDNGNNPNYRIVLAGYDEHNELEQHGWTSHKWVARGGYQKNKQEGNRFRETLWISPHCIQNKELSLL